LIWKELNYSDSARDSKGCIMAKDML